MRNSDGRYDIRMSTALVMAALIADGDSKIYGVNHILRGYDSFLEKLQALGAKVYFGNERLDVESYDDGEALKKRVFNISG